MSINRYNYEEFFLLYADGELNPLETELINQFVQFHPDLKEELDILMDCKLVADIPIFFPKEKLYKQTIWDADNITEMQSNLLLLVDGELAGGFKKELEKNIEENPALQQEWNLLQQAKLPLETIAHPYKKPLYKERKISTLGWLRWAAVAAAIVGTGLFLIDKNIDSDRLVEIPVVASKIDNIKQQVAAVLPQQGSPKNTVAGDAGNESKTSESGNNPIAKTGGLNTISRADLIKQSAKNKIPNTVYKESPEENNNADITPDVAINNNATPDENVGRTTFITTRAIDNVQIIGDNKPSFSKIKIAPKVGQLTSMITKKTAQSVADIQSDADDDEYVRIAGARVKKQKIRGVFRGVFRGIGRTFSSSKVEAAPAMALNND